MKTFKRTIAAVIAAISTAAMAASMAPAFAYEDSAAAKEAFVNSYSNENAKIIAKFCLGEGLSIDETSSMLEEYLNANINNDINTASDTVNPYYNETQKSNQQHYIAAIAMNTNIALDESLDFNLNTTKVNYGGTASLCGNYISAPNMDFTASLRNGNQIRTNISCDAISTTKNVVAKYSLNIVNASSESQIFGAVDMVDKYGTGHMTYATYVLGDVDHDGQVTQNDYKDLMDFLVGLRDDFSYTYSGNSNYFPAVNWLAADVNEDGSISMIDAVDIREIYD